MAASPWLAEDTTLERKVARKVLPAGVATDPDRLARFQRANQQATRRGTTAASGEPRTSRSSSS
jgi:hypothetical protein